MNYNFLSKSKNKCKATWHIIKDKVDCEQSFESVNALSYNGKTITEPQQIAEAFNDYFIGITNNTQTKAVNKINDSLSIQNNVCSIFLKPLTDLEVLRMVFSLNNTKAVGYDGISTHILKQCVFVICPVLKHLLDLSIAQGVFPERLKLSVVKPLHKKENRKDLNNYRPITLIPILAKIFEKAMHNRLTDFLDKYNVIREEQNGFQKRKSTTLAAFALVHSVVDLIDKRVPVSVIFFDMSKAFDFVDHNILLKKCEIYGIRGPALDWLKSYLTGRKQYVEVKNLNQQLVSTPYKSSAKYNNVGVPQGSILGPLLFLLYINDLPNITKNQCVLFADDVSIVVADKKNGNGNDTFIDLLNSEAELVVSWLERNNLRANISKTKFINFQNYNNPNKFNVNLTCRNELIENADEIKFLGITLDKHLNWKSHIDKMCKRLNRFVFALKRLRRTSDQNTALTAYFGYVTSVLRYGLMIWGNSTHIKRAFIVQKKCVRAVCGIGPLQSCKPLFKKLKLLTLTGMYIFQIGCFVREHASFFDHFIDKCNSRIKNRDPTRLILPTCKTALSSKNCFVMTIKIFNKIPRDIRELPIKQFKTKLHRWLTEKSFYDIRELF